MNEAAAKVNNEFLFVHRLANGERKHVRVFSSRILSRGQELLFSVVFDITDQIVFENKLIDLNKKLEESEKRHRFLAENSTDVIVQLNSELVCEYVSNACQSLLGYDPCELIGQSPLDFIHPQDRKEIVDLQLFTLNPNRIVTFTHRIKKKNGIYTWFETTAKSITDHHNRVI